MWCPGGSRSSFDIRDAIDLIHEAIDERGGQVHPKWGRRILDDGGQARGLGNGLVIREYPVWTRSPHVWRQSHDRGRAHLPRVCGVAHGLLQAGGGNVCHDRDALPRLIDDRRNDALPLLRREHHELARQRRHHQTIDPGCDAEVDLRAQGVIVYHLLHTGAAEGDLQHRQDAAQRRMVNHAACTPIALDGPTLPLRPFAPPTACTARGAGGWPDATCQPRPG